MTLLGEDRLWLLLDVSYLGWKAHHSTGMLSEGGQPTGVIYGLVRDILKFRQKFNPVGTVFAFDNGRSLRRAMTPSYKKKRELTAEEKEVRRSVHEQIDSVRQRLLRLGYKNVFSQPGYEGDDVIARACLDLPSGDRAVIVTSDHDMYQLITGDVAVYHPTKEEMVDADAFIKRYRVTPEQWVKVKSIAGCVSDKVDGVDGVGEITACKYLRGQLPEKSKIRRKIEGSYELISSNKVLVKLPYPGMDHLELTPDDVPLSAWEKELKQLKMPSLRKMILT